MGIDGQCATRLKGQGALGYFPRCEATWRRAPPPTGRTARQGQLCPKASGLPRLARVQTPDGQTIARPAARLDRAEPAVLKAWNHELLAAQRLGSERDRPHSRSRLPRGCVASSL